MVLQNLAWKVLQHPTHLVPTDYHLFRCLQNGLSDVSSHNDAQLRKWLGDWFVSKTAEFFKRGIQKSDEKFQKRIRKKNVNNGEENTWWMNFYEIFEKRKKQDFSHSTKPHQLMEQPDTVFLKFTLRNLQFPITCVTFF